MENDEKELIVKAKKYLKATCGEDTVSMTVKKNTVESGTGVLSVDCTVSVWGSRSDWSKDFYFKAGKITDMDYRRR